MENYPTESTYRENETPIKIRLWVKHEITERKYEDQSFDSRNLEDYKKNESIYYPLPDNRLPNVFDYIYMDGSLDLKYLNDMLVYTDKLGSGYVASSTKKITNGILEFKYESDHVLSKIGMTVKNFIDKTTNNKPKRSPPNRKAPKLYTPQKPICKFYQQGKCAFGDRCKNYHGN